LKGRGALQDIDQMSLVESAVKWKARCTTVARLVPMLERAMKEATSGVPGPVFLEVPVDVLYPEAVVRDMFMKESGAANAKTLGQKAIGVYLKGHLYRQFHAPYIDVAGKLPDVKLPPRVGGAIDEAAELLMKAERPALVIGSQTLVNCRDPKPVAKAIETLGMPTWLGGMARGLLGKTSAIQFRHARGKALKDADVAVICGFPFDFRMKYGLGFGRKTKVVSANLSSEELRKNRRPDVACELNASEFLIRLAAKVQQKDGWKKFAADCKQREDARDAEIRSRRRPASWSTRFTSSSSSKSASPTIRFWSPTEAISSPLPRTSCARASRCPGSTLACSELWAWVGVSRSARARCGPRPRRGSSTATARARTASRSSIRSFATAWRRSR
jgi:acetolactate synthase-1/2/3 large subunit